MKVNLFIETKNTKTPEYVFFKILLERIKKEYGIVEYEIIPTDGKDNLEHIANKFKENTLEDGRNIMVFDADFSGIDEGGYESRRKYLEAYKKSLEIDFELFLMPNNKEDGNFETLLESIARCDLHPKFFECFDLYEICINTEKNSDGKPKYKTPNKKGKLHTYITSMPLSKKEKDRIGSGNWLFEDTKYWDLDSDKLKPLIEFLRKKLA